MAAKTLVEYIKQVEEEEYCYNHNNYKNMNDSTT